MVGSLFGFYVWVDLYAVVMVEHFWSFSHDLFRQSDAKRVYSIIGSGGLLGGFVGDAVAAWTGAYVRPTALIFISVAILAIQLVINLAADDLANGNGAPEFPVDKHSSEITLKGELGSLASGFSLVLQNPYLLLIFGCMVFLPRS